MSHSFSFFIEAGQRVISSNTVCGALPDLVGSQVSSCQTRRFKKAYPIRDDL